MKNRNVCIFLQKLLLLLKSRCEVTPNSALGVSGERAELGALAVRCPGRGQVQGLRFRQRGW